MTDPALKQQFLDGMSRAAATVNVVTTTGTAGRSGVTVSSMTSVSADAELPVILICIHHLGQAVSAIINNGVFAVSVLRADQTFISNAFAGRGKEDIEDRFACTDWIEMKSGSPRVIDPVSAFDCKILSVIRIETHYVIMGSVQDIYVSDNGQPLIYSNRTYGFAERILPFQADQKQPGGSMRIGVLSMFGSDLVPLQLKKLEQEVGSTEVEIYEGDQIKIAGLLRERKLDLAYLYDYQLGSDLVLKRLGTHLPCVLVSPEHELAPRSDLSLKDLAVYPLVLLDAPPMRHYLHSLFENAKLTPKIAYRPWSLNMAMSMITNNLGYGLVMNAPEQERLIANYGLISKPLVDHVDPLFPVLAHMPGSQGDQKKKFTGCHVNQRFLANMQYHYSIQANQGNSN